MREIHTAQAQIYQEMRDLSVREKVRYFQRAGERFTALKRQPSHVHRVKH